MLKKNSISALALSVLKFELMGKFFAAVISVFILSIATYAGFNGAVLNQILVLIAYCASFYSVLWKRGMSDVNMASVRKKDMLTGLKAGLLASVPYFLGALIVIVLKLVNADASVLWYRILNVQYISFYTSVFPHTNRLDEISLSTLLISVIPLFILPLETQIAYILGRKKFSVSEHMVYKNLSKKK